MSRILFVMLHPGFIRYYEDAIHLLAASGHEVNLAFEISRDKLGEDMTAQRLAASSPNIHCEPAPERTESVRDFIIRSDRTATRAGDQRRQRSDHEAWESLATTVRLIEDYLRFFEPEFRDASTLRGRVEKRLPRVYTQVLGVAGRPQATRRIIRAALRGVEAIIPTADGIDNFLRERNPDLLLVTPLIELGSQQVDYIKSARKLGIRSALCVASWDNLTSKGLIRVLPDHVLVWNEAQAQEATTLHGVPPDCITVTGAQTFDRWFAMRPSRSREDFCRTVGLDPGRPFLLYTGSSVFIAPDEVPFAERWLTALRHSGIPRVSDVGALIRPHPANSRQWYAFDSAAFANAAVWPPVGTDPNSHGFKEDFFDSVYYSAGVVGINTSAQIEASILGRPIFTVRSPEFAHGQEGTLHFRYLAGDGGVVRAATSLAEHVQHLASELEGDAAGNERHREFVRRFVRPHGLDRPATPIFARAVDALRQLAPPAARPDSLWVRTARMPGRSLAAAALALAEGRPVWVYVMRQPMTLAIHTVALGYRLTDQWQAHGRPVIKRMRRVAWRWWYESSQWLGHRWHRSKKKLLRMTRGARGTARRFVGLR
jgi:hypothetical protein